MNFSKEFTAQYAGRLSLGVIVRVIVVLAVGQHEMAWADELKSSERIVGGAVSPTGDALALDLGTEIAIFAVGPEGALKRESNIPLPGMFATCDSGVLRDSVPLEFSRDGKALIYGKGSSVHVFGVHEKKELRVVTANGSVIDLVVHREGAITSLHVGGFLRRWGGAGGSLEWERTSNARLISILDSCRRWGNVLTKAFVKDDGGDGHAYQVEVWNSVGDRVGSMSLPQGWSVIGGMFMSEPGAGVLSIGSPDPKSLIFRIGEDGTMDWTNLDGVPFIGRCGKMTESGRFFTAKTDQLKLYLGTTFEVLADLGPGVIAHEFVNGDSLLVAIRRPGVVEAWNVGASPAWSAELRTPRRRPGWGVQLTLLLFLGICLIGAIVSRRSATQRL